MPVITEQLELDRGIAPVASGVDTLGGSIRVVESQARFDEVSGLVSGQYQHNGEQSRIGVKSNFGGERQALMLYGDLFKGNDVPESGDNHPLLPGSTTSRCSVVNTGSTWPTATPMMSR